MVDGRLAIFSFFRNEDCCFTRQRLPFPILEIELNVDAVVQAGTPWQEESLFHSELSDEHPIAHDNHQVLNLRLLAVPEHISPRDTEMRRIVNRHLGTLGVVQDTDGAWWSS